MRVFLLFAFLREHLFDHHLWSIFLMYWSSIWMVCLVHRTKFIDQVTNHLKFELHKVWYSNVSGILIVGIQIPTVFTGMSRQTGLASRTIGKTPGRWRKAASGKTFLFVFPFFFIWYWFDSLSIEYYDYVKERLPLMVTIQPWVFITKCWSRQYDFKLVRHPTPEKGIKKTSPGGIRPQDLPDHNLEL